MKDVLFCESAADGLAKVTLQMSGLPRHTAA